MSIHQPEDLGVLRFITAGSVDDGKSTLIGRLLYDSKAVLSTSCRPSSRAKNKRTVGDEIDLSLLTDGLEAEREQGITIDVAYRYFATAEAQVHHRRYAGPRAVHAQHGDGRIDGARRDHSGRRHARDVRGWRRRNCCRRPCVIARSSSCSACST